MSMEAIEAVIAEMERVGQENLAAGRLTEGTAVAYYAGRLREALANENA